MNANFTMIFVLNTTKFNIYLKSLCFQWISFAVCNPIRHSSWMEIQVYFLDVMNFINWIMKYDLSWNAKWVEIILMKNLIFFCSLNIYLQFIAIISTTQYFHHEFWPSIRIVDCTQRKKSANNVLFSQCRLLTM